MSDELMRVDLPCKSSFKDLRDKAFKIMTRLRQKNFTNENNGVTVKITREGIDKILSSKAVNKTVEHGYEKEFHFAAAQKVGNLFEKARFSHSEEARNKSADIVTFHKYLVDFRVENKLTRAKITVKESVGHKIYSLELLELK